MHTLAEPPPLTFSNGILFVTIYHATKTHSSSGDRHQCSRFRVHTDLCAAQPRWCACILNPSAVHRTTPEPEEINHKGRDEKGVKRERARERSGGSGERAGGRAFTDFPQIDRGYVYFNFRSTIDESFTGESVLTKFHFYRMPT